MRVDTWTSTKGVAFLMPTRQLLHVDVFCLYSDTTRCVDELGGHHLVGGHHPFIPRVILNVDGGYDGATCPTHWIASAVVRGAARYPRIHFLLLLSPYASRTPVFLLSISTNTPEVIPMCCGSVAGLN